MTLEENVALVKERIRAAARSAGESVSGSRQSQLLARPISPA